MVARIELVTGIDGDTSPIQAHVSLEETGNPLLQGRGMGWAVVEGLFRVDAGTRRIPISSGEFSACADAGTVGSPANPEIGGSDQSKECGSAVASRGRCTPEGLTAACQAVRAFGMTDTPSAGPARRHAAAPRLRSECLRVRGEPIRAGRRVAAAPAIPAPAASL